MDFFEDSLERVKSIVRISRKYRFKTGLITSMPDLVMAKRNLLQKGLIHEALELEQVIEFLTEEEESLRLTHKKLLDKTKELSDLIPIGMLINFRHEGGNLNGELLGFLADRALVRVTKNQKETIYEVNPFDIKT